MSASDRSGAGDVGSLYRSLSARLEQIVRLDVRAPDQVIEDACQVAWSRLVRDADRVSREAALSWLAKTAVHEALRLIRRNHREVPLDTAFELSAEPGPASSMPAPDELLEQRERLRAIRDLPERQQLLLWLRGLGLSYAEMSVYTGCTPRTVERQLLRAKERMRLLAAG